MLLSFAGREGIYDRLSQLVAELIATIVDILITHGTPGTRVAKQASTTIPIVTAINGDAIATVSSKPRKARGEPHRIDFLSSTTQCEAT